MRKLFVLFAAVVAFSLVSVAQSAPMTPSMEVFGGYSWLRTSANGASQNYNGFNGAVNGNVNRWLGIAGQFGGYFASPSGVKARTQTYMFGPTIFSRSNEQFTPFAHVLFGQMHSSASSTTNNVTTSVSASAFAYGFGGGLDWNLRGNLAIRAAQLDYIRANFSGGSVNNIRISTGVVWRFGVK